MLELSMRQARRLMIGSQGLAGPPPKRASKNKALKMIRQLGALQIDSINVVARTHHIVLWSRIGEHPLDWVYELQAEGEILEYWAHACAYTPMELYPCFRKTMLEFPRSAQTKEWMLENQEILDDVVETIRSNGPSAVRDFEAPPDAEKAHAWAWYGNKPAKRALALLWTNGTLMVTRRERFQRIFDVTERALPVGIDCEPLDPDERNQILAATALDAMGLTTARWLPDYFRTSGERIIRPASATDVLQELVEVGKAVPARVKGIDQDVFVSSAALERRFKPSRTTLLSPFDSLIWDRNRAQEMFDYTVKFEPYVPKAKRQYGYFNLAILHRDQIVGQLDPKVDRKTGVLHIKSLHLEPGYEPDDRFYQEFATMLHSFKRFNDATEIQLNSCCNPDHVSEPLCFALKETT